MENEFNYIFGDNSLAIFKIFHFDRQLLAPAADSRTITSDRAVYNKSLPLPFELVRDVNWMLLTG